MAGDSDAIRPSALAALGPILARIGRRPVAVFLDYDGTLTPIVGRPEDAQLAASVRAVVARLVASAPVAIVSGRDRAVVEGLVGIPAAAYVGSHGLDIAGPAGSGVRHAPAEAFLPAIDAAERALRARLATVPGARVERKRFTVASHYRQVAPPLHAAVEAAVDAVRAAHPELRKEGGKAVWELRPDIAWDKGRAVRWLVDHLGLADVIPLYVGDDLTDEFAFEAIGPAGITVVVDCGERPSAAEFALADPPEVERFLVSLAETLEARGGP